jgi:hypothetical protein
VSGYRLLPSLEGLIYFEDGEGRDTPVRAVLDDPPAGVFDPRSWAYWNLMFDREAPELPRKRPFA